MGITHHGRSDQRYPYIKDVDGNRIASACARTQTGADTDTHGHQVAPFADDAQRSTNQTIWADMSTHSSPLSALAHQLARQYPRPPRPVGTTATLRAVFQVRSMRLVAISMLVLAVMLFMAAAAVPESWGALLMGLAGLCVTLLSVPIVYALRLHKSMRTAKVVRTTIEDLTHQPATQQTPNGITEGVLRFEDGSHYGFEIDEPWGRDLRVGAPLELFFGADRPGYVFPLKPETTADTAAPQP